MPRDKDDRTDGTDEYADPTGPNRSGAAVTRRRFIQAGLAGVLGSVAVATVRGGKADHPNTLVVDGTVSKGKSKYHFEVTGSAEPLPDTGPLEASDTIDGSYVAGAVHRDVDAYRFSGTLTSLDISGAAEVAVTYGDEEDIGADRLEIVADSGEAVDYSFTATDRIVPVTDNGSNSAEDVDGVVENGDGTWTADGSVGDGWGDTFDFWGDITDFAPMDGNCTLYLNGSRLSTYDLTGETAPETREHSYSFEGTGDSPADYYLEVEDGGDIIASTVDGAVIEEDFHWISDDGTKAAGRVDPGERHAYEFDTLVQDVTIEGEADAFVNGSPSNLDYYPQPGATGDDWKSGFPWQETDVEREHSYSFEGTGDSWADYYLEVEDGGNMIASTVDGAVIEPDFHWVSDDGTKAAGRVDPGERHAYEFDTLVQDVTIEGEADAFVNGSPSNLDYYPQPGATGDDWKGGFPWQDEEDTSTSTGPAIGGGSGYDRTVSESDADAVVRTRSELDDALAGATSGDVVFVPGDESISLGDRRYDIPDGVTLASSRGVDGSSGALLYTDSEPWKLLTVDGSGRLTGVRLRGPHPGDDTSKESSGTGVQTYGASEVDNCDIRGFSYAGVRVAGGDGARIHHNVIRENNTGGIGYGVAAESGTPIVEYNYFNFNRHSVKSAGQNPGYVVRYNHFGPDSAGGVIDVHDPGGVDLEVHNNVIEPTVSTSGHRDPLQAIQIRGTPDDVYDAHDNWFWNELPPRDDPSGWTNESIIQATEDTWQNIEWSNNHYGADANVTYSDVISGYDGWRSP